ncbi:MAG: hypothetical protein M3O50_12235 [Myxococcota bacterium]|nr:hypothetical protein [Myxococcota bacterium]
MYLESALNPTKDHPDFPVYACGYDWRLSNTDSAATLSALVDTLLNRYSGRAKDVIVLTHSQGGLVVRGGLVADGSLEAKIRGIVHTVQPSNGSVTCYRRFLTGAAKPLDTEKTVTDIVLNNIMGTSFAEYAYNLSGLPGTLQLLPNHVYAKFVPGNWLEGVDSSVDLGDIYNVYRRECLPGIAGIVSTAQRQCGTTEEISSGSVASDFANNLAEAERFHKAVETRAHSRTYVLYSTGRPTDQSIAFLDMSAIQFGSISALDYSEDVVDPMTGTVVGVARPQWTFDRTDVNDQRSQIVYRKPPEGDGTVSESSATCPGLAVLAPTPMAAGAALQHSDVFANADFN